MQDITAAAASLLVELAGPTAVLRDDQLAAIEAVVVEHRRVLVVQRTGWGKSAVYFIATRLLREAGAGPTLLVSPLLALMRDQIANARRIGVRAETINSTNLEDWTEIEHAVAEGTVDLLCISPERLNNPSFRSNVLPRLTRSVGLLVVDEAHCISDWGHDFRPDYRRIVSVLADLGTDVPVLCTTATANERVSIDVAEQLGGAPLTLRGPLERASLALSVVRFDSGPERLAWLADLVPGLEGSGIVYCLTVADTESVAAWLRACRIDAVAYSGATEPAERERIEAALLADEIKVVVATSALGMGFDKANLAFVVHHGMPPSPIAYYQQVGRAGRALDRAVAILSPGREDAAVWAWFDATAMPPEAQTVAVLRHLERVGGVVSIAALEEAVNMRRGRLEALLKVLDVEGAVERTKSGWSRTEAPWTYDSDRIDRVAAARQAEQEAMTEYSETTSCLMAFLRGQLDDPDDSPCGRCDNCTDGVAPTPPDAGLVAKAAMFLRSRDVLIEPRRRWPTGLGHPKGNIGPATQVDTGRALATASDPIWTPLLAPLLDADGPVPVEVLDGVLGVLKRWDWVARPTWVTYVPSRSHPLLVESLAEGIASKGRLPLFRPVERALDNPPQAGMDNSAYQCRNAWEAFSVAEDELPSAGVVTGPVLLVDDVTRSGWTLTVVGALMRAAGADAVLPLVLQSR